MLDDEGNGDDGGKVAGRGRIGDRTPSVAAVEAIAAFRGVEPTAIEEPLYDSVDTDALDSVLRSQSEEPITVTFGAGDLVVEMSSDGSLEIYERPD